VAATAVQKGPKAMAVVAGLAAEPKQVTADVHLLA